MLVMKLIRVMSLNFQIHVVNWIHKILRLRLQVHAYERYTHVAQGPIGGQRSRPSVDQMYIALQTAEDQAVAVSLAWSTA